MQRRRSTIDTHVAPSRAGAKPSRELLLYLADELEMPQRAVDDMLLAAGFAPVFSEYSLDDAAMAAARHVMCRLNRATFRCAQVRGPWVDVTTAR